MRYGIDLFGPSKQDHIEAAQSLNSKAFNRLTGVHKQTFKMMLNAWDEYHASQSNAGRSPKLNRPNQLMVALQYWREYRTHFHIANDWDISFAVFGYSAGYAFSPFNPYTTFRYNPR